MGTRGWAVIHEHLRRVLAEFIAGDVREALQARGRPSHPTPPDVLVQCVAATFVLTLSWWVESDSGLSAQEVNDLFRAMILPTLAATLE